MTIPQPEAVEFLISRIKTAVPDAVHAIRALAPIRSYDNIANRVLGRTNLREP